MPPGWHPIERCADSRATTRKPHQYEDYRRVHWAYVEELRSEGLLIDDTFAFRQSTDRKGRLREVLLHGRAATVNGAVVEVKKWLAVSYRGKVPYVRTREYNYHAWVENSRQNLFRYDNCHGAVDTLHRHDYLSPQGNPDYRSVAADEMPYLSDVIREADELARQFKARL